MQLKINKFNDAIFEWIPYNDKKEWIRESPHERVCLRYLHNSQYEIESSSLNYISSNDDYSNDDYQNYGISQNSDSKDYILPHDPVFEWIPYNEFINVKEIGDNCLTTVVCKEGPFYYDTSEEKWIRISREIVCLRYLRNLQDITDEVINKIKSYLFDGGMVYYGISVSGNVPKN
ncbi:unnamed protein product [Rhizophagus irregularis]|nr:unnamed protein product [Rhizophagus irregularis]